MPIGSPPLCGIRVVESTAGLAGSYAGFLLSELGAELVKVETAARPETVPGDRVLDRGKRSVVLDLAGGADAACWRALVAGADATLVDESSPDPAPGEGLVRCRVTAWGRAGHPRGLPGEEPLVAAATGVQSMQWSWSGSPVWLVTPMISYMSGMLAALGVVGALYARGRGAPGQQVDVSDAGASFALNSGTYVTGPDHRGSLTQHGDPRGVYPTYGLYQTADGWLFVGALTQTFWVKLMTLLDRVDLLADPRLQVNPLAFGTPEIKRLVRGVLEPLFQSKTTAGWVRALREADIPCGAVQTHEEFMRDPEARELGLVVPVEDPMLGPTWQPASFAVFSDTPAPAPRAAARRGADTAAVRREAAAWRRPAASAPGHVPATCLEGVRVLDLASFIAGPFCPLLLADLGADVVKIESREGDPFRMAAFGFVGWNRGKRSLVLDLKCPEGVEVFLSLARRADVVIDNFRAGVMERLGIGWDRLRDENPRLVHTSITGYGSTGRLATLPGFDPVFQARSGLVRVQGGSDEPVMHLIAYNDYCAGALGALATVAALLARERTGRGQRVDVSLFRTAFAAQAAVMILHGGRTERERGGRDHLGPSACRRLYPCRDGWICIAARTPAEAAGLGRLADVEMELESPADGEAAAAIARTLADEPRARALERLDAAGVPAASCLEFDDLFADAYLRQSGTVVEHLHPTLGALLVGGPFVRFERTPVVYGRSAPLLGHDGAAILAEIGYRPERIARLVESGVVGGP